MTSAVTGAMLYQLFLTGIPNLFLFLGIIALLQPSKLQTEILFGDHDY